MQRACFHFRCAVCVLAFSQSRVARVVDSVEFAAGWELAVAGRLDDAREQFAYVKTLTDDLLALMSETIPRLAEPVLSPPGRLDDVISTL
jgi:hypothetical protein